MKGLEKRDGQLTDESKAKLLAERIRQLRLKIAGFRSARKRGRRGGPR